MTIFVPLCCQGGREVTAETVGHLLLWENSAWTGEYGSLWVLLVHPPCTGRPNLGLAAEIMMVSDH